jgi:hypothetical protein
MAESSKLWEKLTSNVFNKIDKKAFWRILEHQAKKINL